MTTDDIPEGSAPAAPEMVQSGEDLSDMTIPEGTALPRSEKVQKAQLGGGRSRLRGRFKKSK